MFAKCELVAMSCAPADIFINFGVDIVNLT